MSNNLRNGGGALIIAAASALGFISLKEGDKPVVYADKLAYNVPTVCSGHTGPDVKLGDVWTAEQCNKILQKDVTTAGTALLKCITVPISQNQFDAFQSLTFNVGAGAVCKSTLIKLVNAGKPTEACNQLLRWDRAGGVVVKGLHNRRVAERDLCLRPDVPGVIAPGVQA